MPQHPRAARRIAIAGSDAGASAYLNTAIDEAWQAVGERSGWSSGIRAGTALAGDDGLDRRPK
jgi:hypothetical protein